MFVAGRRKKLFVNQEERKRAWRFACGLCFLVLFSVQVRWWLFGFCLPSVLPPIHIKRHNTTCTHRHSDDVMKSRHTFFWVHLSLRGGGGGGGGGAFIQQVVRVRHREAGKDFLAQDTVELCMYVCVYMCVGERECELGKKGSFLQISSSHLLCIIHKLHADVCACVCVHACAYTSYSPVLHSHPSCRPNALPSAQW